jgi:pimeloyl-ACP methyl ester carboxylesterase
MLARTPEWRRFLVGGPRPRHIRAVRGEFVDLGGVRIYCYAAGERGRGAPIVLVHDAFASSHVWHDFVPLLPAGHRVLVVDLAAHGRSDPPLAIVAGQLSVRAHASRLRALLEQLRVGRAVFVGHGVGAAVVATAAARSPDQVAGLTLVAPSALPADAPRPFRRMARLVPLWRRLPPAWVASSLHSASVRGYAERDRGARSADLVLRPVRGFETAGRDAACAQLSALVAPDTSLSRAELQQLGETLSATAAPVSVIGGASDPACSRAALQSIAHALHTDAIVLEGAKHALPEERPDAVLAAVERTLDRALPSLTPLSTPVIPA